MRYGAASDPIAGVASALADQQAWNDPSAPFTPSLSFKGVAADRSASTGPVGAAELQQLLRVLNSLRLGGQDWRLNGQVK